MSDIDVNVRQYENSKGQEERRRRCRLYGTGVHAVKKIKRRKAPLLEKHSTFFQHTPADLASAEKKLKECHLLRDYGTTHLQRLYTDKFVTLAEILRLMEKEYRLILSAAEVSALVETFACVEEGKIVFSLFLTHFMRVGIKAREEAHEKAERETELHDKERRRARGLDLVLFPEEKVDDDYVTSDVLISALEKINFHIKRYYAEFPRYFFNLRLETGSLSVSGLRDWFRNQIDCCSLTLEESQAVVTQFAKVSGGTAEHIPLQFIAHQCRLCATATNSAFNNVTQAQLDDINRPVPPVVGNHFEYMRMLQEHEEGLLLPMPLPVTLPAENSKAAVSNLPNSPSRAQEAHSKLCTLAVQPKPKPKHFFGPAGEETTNFNLQADPVSMQSAMKKAAAGEQQQKGELGSSVSFAMNFSVDNIYRDMGSGEVDPYAARLGNINNTKKSKPNKTRVHLLTPLDGHKEKDEVKSGESIFSSSQSLVRPSSSIESAVRAGEALKGIILNGDKPHSDDEDEDRDGSSAFDEMRFARSLSLEEVAGSSRTGGALHGIGKRRAGSLKPLRNKSHGHKGMSLLKKAVAEAKKGDRPSSDEDEEEDDNSTMELRQRKRDAAKNAGSPQAVPYSEGRLPYSNGSKMSTNAGGSSNIMRAKTPMKLKRPVNPSQDRGSVSKLVSPVHYANSASLNNNATRIDAPLECKAIATHSAKVSQLSLDAKTSLLRYSMRWPMLAKIIKSLKKELLTINQFLTAIYRNMDEEADEIRSEAEQREAEAELRVLEQQARIQGGIIAGKGREKEEPAGPQKVKNPVISYTNADTGSFASRKVMFTCCKSLFKDELSDRDLHTFISVMDPYRTNLISVALVSALLHCFIWAERSSRVSEKIHLVSAITVQRERKRAVAVLKGGGQGKTMSKENEGGGPDVNPYLSGDASGRGYVRAERQLQSEEMEEARRAEAEFEGHLEIRELSPYEDGQFDKWHKSKPAKHPGVSAASRLVYGALFELQRSLGAKYFTISSVEIAFCSLCVNQVAEMQLQRFITPGLMYIRQCRQRALDTRDDAFDELCFLEQRLIQQKLFTFEHVMQLVTDNIHDIGTLVQEQFDQALVNLGYQIAV